jgi:hypothetical protein
MEFLCKPFRYSGNRRDRIWTANAAGAYNDIEIETRMVGLVDIALPANGQAAAEALGLKVERSVTSGARVVKIPREEAEIAIECLRDWGISARILDGSSRSQTVSAPGPAPAA